MGNFTGKVAVITGGNSGIGLATAQELEAQGAKVVIFGRNQEKLNEAKAQLNGHSVSIQGDVTKVADLERLFAETERQLGKIDVLFVNAGVALPAPLDSVTEEFWDNQFNINVKGAFFTVQKAVPHLNEGASIILNTSVVNGKGWAGMSVYGATKAALRYLARTLSAELVGKGIRVNAVSPGPISTPIYGKMGMPEEQLNEFAANVQGQVPMGRFGEPTEVAKAVAFLASTDSSYVLGSELAVDGGLSQL